MVNSTYLETIFSAADIQAVAELGVLRGEDLTYKFC